MNGLGAREKAAFSDAAIADILEQSDWYEAQADRSLSQRWEEAVTATLLRIAQRPGLSLRWKQVDLENLVIHLCDNVKTKDSAQPVPLTRLACDVLREWRNGQTRQSPFVFPSPYNLDKRIGSVKTAWKATLRRAGVSYFPIYNLRHVFCTRLSWVAPDAVVQHAMRHSSPETKRFYQLGLAHQVREHLERVN